MDVKARKERIDAAAKRYSANRDPKDREEVANLIQPMLGSFAREFVKGKPIEPDIALSSANLGLLDALEKYQPDRGARFVSFAKHRICGAMLDGVREEDPNCRLSLARERRNNAVADAFFKQHGRQPTPEELETLIDEPGEKTTPLMRTTSIPATDSWRREYVIESDPSKRPDLDDAFNHITRGMDRRERMAFTMYYRDNLKMIDIATACGVSESRISQILASIKARMDGHAAKLAESVGVG